MSFWCPSGGCSSNPVTRAWPLQKPILLVAGAVIIGLVSIAAAQDGPGGKLLTLTLGQSLRYSDSIDLQAGPTESTLRSRTSLGLTYSDITRTQDFQFSLGGAYEIDDGGTNLDDPFARLSYAREGANSRLSFSADYTRTDLDDAFRTVDPTLIPPVGGDPEVIVSNTALIESGVRADSRYALRFETGLRSNTGLVLNLSEDTRRFSQTTDPDLFDSRTRQVSAEMRFRINPQLTALVTGSARRYEAENIDQTDRLSTSFGVGVEMDVSPTLSFDAAVRQKHTKTRRVSGTVVSDGLAYDLGLARRLPNGQIGVDFTSEPTLNGRRSTLQANRQMTLRREGTLSYGIGVSKTEGFSSEPLFNIAYVQPLKRGTFDVQFSQQARTDEEDDEAVILTTLSANYAMPLSDTLNWSIGVDANDVAASGATGEDRRQLGLRTNLSGQINSISSWSAGMTLGDVRTTLAGATESERRYGLQLAYRREVARDWDMVARYQHTNIMNSAAADRRSNAISMGLEKSFSFRP